MNEFRKLEFEYKCKHSLNKYRDFVEEYIKSEREKLNALFDKYDANDKIKNIFEKSDYKITFLIDTKKPSFHEEGFLFGSLAFTKDDRIVIFLLAKDIDSLYTSSEKELSYFEILKTLIHEFGHIYTKNENENIEFTDFLINELSLIDYLDYKITDLLYLQQVGPKRIKSMNSIGIFSLADINEQNRDKLKNLPGSSDWHVNKWLEQVKVINEGNLIFKKTEYVDKLIENNLLIFDIETDEFQKQIFLIGIYNTYTKEFNQFFDKDDEKKLLQNFCDYMNHFKNYILISYSNNRFDERILKERLMKNNLQSIQHEFLDLGINITDIVIGKLSSSDYNAKKLGKLFDYKVRTNLTGNDVGSYFSNYLEKNKECDWNKIKIYNEDDVMSIKLIIEKIKSGVK